VTRKTFWAVFTVLLAAGAPPAAAQPCAGPPAHAERAVCPAGAFALTATSAIEGQLSAPVSLHFHDVPLSHILEDLHEMTGVAIVLDRAALREAGRDLDGLSVTIRVEGLTLKTALNLVTTPMRLAWVVKDDAIHVTTRAAAAGKPRVVTYPVADLIVPIGSGESELLPLICRNDRAFARKHVPGTTCEDALLGLITRTIAPASWSENGGPGSIQFFPLGMAVVVTQTPDVQEQIQELLAALRRAQEAEDREYHLTTKLVEVRPGGERAETPWPRVTFVRGQKIRVTTREAVALVPTAPATGVLQSAHREASGLPARLGASLQARVTRAEGDLVNLEAVVEKTETVRATRKGVQTTSRTYRLSEKTAPGQAVRLLLETDATGQPRRWVEFTLTEVETVPDGGTVQMGGFPPIPAKP
jgi:hypothetical protein